MVLVLAGTSEGREITSILAARGYRVVTVISMDGESRMIVRDALEGDGREYSGPGGIYELIEKNGVRVVVDMSHPFSQTISGPLNDYCRTINIPYLRFVREEVDLPESPLLFPVYSWEEAAERAAGLGSTIFLTTGSYNLDLFIKHQSMAGKRLVVRVLPDPRVIAKVCSLGISPRDIVAMQGPFSKEMNKATFKMYNASVVVTKDSGRVGGTDSKISAALNLKIPVVVIRRPKVKGKNAILAYTYAEILDKISLYY